ncbi:hypothetical protein NQ317_017068, partial [Molorchus minor]
MRISRIPKYNFNPMVNKTHVVWIYFVVLIQRLYLPRKKAIMNFRNNHVQAEKNSKLVEPVISIFHCQRDEALSA